MLGIPHLVSYGRSIILPLNATNRLSKGWSGTVWVVLQSMDVGCTIIGRSLIFEGENGPRYRGLETNRTHILSGFVLDFVYKIPGVFKNQKLSFQGVFVRSFLCHTSCFSVFFAEKV